MYHELKYGHTPQSPGIASELSDPNPNSSPTPMMSLGLADIDDCVGEDFPTPEALDEDAVLNLHESDSPHSPNTPGDKSNHLQAFATYDDDNSGYSPSFHSNASDPMPSIEDWGHEFLERIPRGLGVPKPAGGLTLGQMSTIDDLVVIYGCEERRLTFDDVVAPAELQFSYDIDTIVAVTHDLSLVRGYMNLVPRPSPYQAISGNTNICCRLEPEVAQSYSTTTRNGHVEVPLHHVPNCLFLVNDRATINVCFPHLMEKGKHGWVNTVKKEYAQIFWDDLVRPALESGVIPPSQLAHFPLTYDIDLNNSKGAGSGIAKSYGIAIPSECILQLESVIRELTGVDK